MGYDKVDTVMQGVHTVVALPQWYVNFNLSVLLASGTTADGKSLKQVRLATAPDQPLFLDGVVKALRVVVHDPGRPAGVKFIVQFASGTLDYYDVAKSPPVKSTADIAGLQLGFDVDLARADLAADQNLPPDVKARVTTLLTNLGPGAFTVRQLLMDFQNAALDRYDAALTTFPPQFPPAAQAALPLYLRTYLAGLAPAGGNVLGYAITVNNPGGIADPVASFPPTSLDFTTNQYLRGPADSPSSLQPDLDTINFLMMTGGAKLPVNLSPAWGNFVVPKDDEGGWRGTIAIAKELFVDEFLLPALAPLLTKYYGLSDATGNLAPVTTLHTGAFTSDRHGGSWQSGQQSSHSHVTNTWSNDDTFFNFDTSVVVGVGPGTNKITIRRTTNFDLQYMHTYGVEGTKGASQFRVWYSVPLTITVELLGIADGKLVVRTSSETRQPEPGTLYGDPFGWNIVRVDGSASIWDSVASTMDKVITDFVSVAIPAALLPGVEQAITSQLNLHPFVFPGGNQLFMRTLVFNDEGDLLVGLQSK